MKVARPGTLGYDRLAFQAEKVNMMIGLIFHSVLYLALLAAGVVAYRKKKHSFWCGFFMAVGVMMILSLPAGIWQAVFSWPGISTSGSPVWELFTLPLFGWPFNAGGWTVRWIFETTVEPLEWLVGHRASTVLSNMSYYWSLLAVQSAILAAAAGMLYRKNARAANIALALLATAYLFNSMMNVRWFWAGT